MEQELAKLIEFTMDLSGLFDIPLNLFSIIDQYWPQINEMFKISLNRESAYSNSRCRCVTIDLGPADVA